MDDRLADWLPHSFSRAPAWRLSRAAFRRAEGLRPDPRIDDEWVELAARVLDADARGVPPAVRAAVGVWRRGGVPRWHLEANLLTPRTFAEVGAATGHPEPVVEAYHQLCYDVRPRIAATDWVLARAVGSCPANGFAGPQPAGACKYLGFVGGPVVLDVVVAATLGRPLPPSVRESFAGNPTVEDRALRLRAKLAVAALTARTPARLAAVARARDALRELEVGLGMSTTVAEPGLAVLADLLSAVGRTAGLRGKSPTTAAAGRPRSASNSRRRLTHADEEDTRAPTTPTA